MSLEGNFYELFARHVRAEPGARCCEATPGLVLDRAWFDGQSARYAHALAAAGVQPGDRVAVQVEKSPQSLALYLGCLRLGAVFLPLNTAYTPAELAYLLADARPAAFVARDPEAHGVAQRFSFDEHGAGTLAAAAAGAPSSFDTLARRGDDLAALLYTSGTTGRPKGAMLSHRAMRHAALTLGDAWRFTPADVLLHALPLFHGHGLFVSCNVVLAAGASLLFQRRFDAAAVLQALPRATVFMGVPTYYHRLLQEPGLTQDACRGVRLFTCGSAPLAAAVHHDFAQRTGHGIVERYGATETMILCSNPYDGERRAGAVGRALPGVDLRIADGDDQPLPDGQTGMIQVRGPGLFSGYWGLPELSRREFTADGFFRTGDLGRRGADGYVTITGRSKDLIISGGYNVYPAEVEAALAELDGVHESAVVGVPHADFGEAVVAFVVPADPAAPPAPAAVIDFARRRLANYKVPKQVYVVTELPRNTMGKVLKTELRERLAGAGSD